MDLILAIKSIFIKKAVLLVRLSKAFVLAA